MNSMSLNLYQNEKKEYKLEIGIFKGDDIKTF